MTRKKWNRLRKRRPELFTMVTEDRAWERFSKTLRKRLARYSTRETVAKLTAFMLENR